MSIYLTDRRLPFARLPRLNFRGTLASLREYATILVLSRLRSIILRHTRYLLNRRPSICLKAVCQNDRMTLFNRLPGPDKSSAPWGLHGLRQILTCWRGCSRLSTNDFSGCGRLIFGFRLTYLRWMVYCTQIAIPDFIPQPTSTRRTQVYYPLASSFAPAHS